MSSRRRPLHTCAVSFLAIARKTSQKAKEHNGPIGTLAKRSAILGTLASPIFSALQYLILATLILVDDYLLACEDNLVSIYPPSNRVFNKIDELVRVMETLPGKFDGFWGEFPECVSRVPFLERVLMSVVAWLNFLLSGLVGLGSGKTEEEEIAIDEYCMKSNEDYSVVGSAKVVGEMAKKSFDRKKNHVNEPSQWEENGEIVAEKLPHEENNKEDVATKESSSSEEKEINVDEENYLKNIKDYSVVGPIKESPHKRAEDEKVTPKVASEVAETSSNTEKECTAKEPSHGKENEKITAKKPSHEEENEEITAEKLPDEENNKEEDVAKESSYETDATDGSVYEEVMVSLKDDQSIGASDILERENNENDTRMGENGSNVKRSLAEEWFEAGWVIKPKQAPKRKQKSKKKRN